MESVKGRIVGCTGGLYSVRSDDGEIIKCRARGIFRHSGTKPLVGDIARVVSDKDGAVIGSIGERKNSLIRPPLANIDFVFVTMAASSPKPMIDMTDKLISILEYKSIEPIIIIGKRELDREYAEELCTLYRRAGFNAFTVSCHNDEGIDEVKGFIDENLPSRVAAFAGASGVGKSTLLNKIFPDLSLDTGEVSRKTERGRHTTREVSLFEVSGGYIADTPGFSMLDFERFDFFELEDLVSTFREFDGHIGHCKYTKCSHTKEEGCSILEAVGRGEIAKSRHDSYIMLYDVLKNKHKWDK